jgi:fluoride exporter
MAAHAEKPTTPSHLESSTDPSPTHVSHAWRPGRVPIAMVLVVGCGGVVGAICRYLVQYGLPSHSGRFPTGTFIVNLSGSALLGFLLVVVNGRFADRRLARPLLGTGVIGAYTTFSTFSVEAVLLVRAGQVGTAAVYVTLSVTLGLAAGLAGMSAGRLSLRRLSEAEEFE